MAKQITRRKIIQLFEKDLTRQPHATPQDVAKTTTERVEEHFSVPSDVYLDLDTGYYPFLIDYYYENYD